MGTITRSFANNITSGGTFDATDLTGTIPSSNIADASVGNITDVPALVTTTKESSDPPSPVAGQVWYNTTDRVLRGYVLSAGSWASGGSLNEAREKLGGAGTQTAGLGFAGLPASASFSTKTESYNGTAWTEVNDLNVDRQSVGGTGTQTAALSTGGSNPGTSASADTELWNGTSWTEVNNLNTGRTQPGTTGTQTAALNFGGFTTAPTGVTETWNGTSWTEVNDMNTGRYAIQGAGTQTAAITAGGANPGIVGNVELWNGTSWTETTDLNTARRGAGASDSSPSSFAIFFGGNANPPFTFTGTEEWNGTSWTEINDLSTGRNGLGGVGSTSAALAFGGVIPPQSSATEEWTKTEVVTELGAS